MDHIVQDIILGLVIGLQPMIWGYGSLFEFQLVDELYN